MHMRVGLHWSCWLGGFEVCRGKYSAQGVSSVSLWGFVAGGATFATALKTVNAGPVFKVWQSHPLVAYGSSALPNDAHDSLMRMGSTPPEAAADEGQMAEAVLDSSPQRRARKNWKSVSILRVKSVQADAPNQISAPIHGVRGHSRGKSLESPTRPGNPM